MEPHTQTRPESPSLGWAAFPPIPTPPRRTWLDRLVTPVLAALLGAVIGGAVVVAATDTPAAGPPTAAPRVSGVPQPGLTGVAAVAEHLSPSVVRIDASVPGPLGAASGTGSGVVYRPDGYIITNAHVVAGAQSLEVTLSDGRQLAAEVVGDAMPSDDIAVLKIDATDLEAAPLGSTADVRVGDLAVAIGSPFGLEGSVTAGVVSALHRNIDLGRGARFTDAIQTDAPINPGNSGGALADADGRAIGINTAIVGSPAGNVGVGFAIPIDIARLHADRIIETGRSSRPFLGIGGEDVPGGGGALIQQVVPDAPAEAAGLQVGDVIVAIDGTRVTSMDELISVLSRLEVGRTVTVTYEREGTRARARVTLEERTS